MKRSECSAVLLLLLFSRQVVSDSLWPHGLQHVWDWQHLMTSSFCCSQCFSEQFTAICSYDSRNRVDIVANSSFLNLNPDFPLFIASNVHQTLERSPKATVETPGISWLLCFLNYNLKNFLLSLLKRVPFLMRSWNK